jgi:hypothetical protein
MSAWEGKGRDYEFEMGHDWLKLGILSSLEGERFLLLLFFIREEESFSPPASASSLRQQPQTFLEIFHDH